MNILITGICGFVGSALAVALLECIEGVEIHGIDNLMRLGSELNRRRLQQFWVRFTHGVLRSSSDVEALGPCDWVVDAAANPSVLAGLGGRGGSVRLFEHNLAALIKVLEYCRKHLSGLLLLSSSRVYSIPALVSLPLNISNRAFRLDPDAQLPAGLTLQGIGAGFSTSAPVSLYGATKLASEIMALDYGEAFEFPVWITRCGVLAGADQFGTASQGIFTYWLNAHLRRRLLRYIGFGGTGHQTRDAFHPRDLAKLLIAQMRIPRQDGQRVYTAGGGPSNAMSLAQLTTWCDERFGPHAPDVDSQVRPYDVPWVVMDSAQAAAAFRWEIEFPLPAILDEIAGHARQHPNWLELSGV